MDFFNPREPAAALTHAAGLGLALLGTIFLWNRCRVGDVARRWSLVIFGLSLALCYAGSTLYHAIRLPDDRLDAFDRLDRVGIFLLIAGSYTPLAWTLLRGRWRWGTLGAIWTVAVVGSLKLAIDGPFSPWLASGLYLAMGWGSVVCYAELARAVPHRVLRPLVIGGVLYSVGAVVNLIGWPAPWPGRFGAHEVFHLFVLAGSLAHFRLMLDVVVPFEWSACDHDPRAARALLESTPDLRR